LVIIWGEEVGTSQGYHDWAKVESVLVCPAPESCGLVGGGGAVWMGGGMQGPGRSGLWIIGCSMKIKELCQ
jgi:hypothetical protein